MNDTNKSAQPVEAVSRESREFVLRAMAMNYSAFHEWDKLDADACARGADEIKALRAALAHPRPTGDAVAPKQHNAAYVAGEQAYSYGATFDHSNPYENGTDGWSQWRRRWIAAASGKDLSEPERDATAPTVEQAGEVVDDGIDYLHALDQADVALGVAGLGEDAIFRVELRRAREHFAAQPRPVGVPDAIVKLAAIECARRAYGYWKGDSTGGDSALRYFDGNMSLGRISHTIDLMESAIRKHIAAAPAPAKAGGA